MLSDRNDVLIRQRLGTYNILSYIAELNIVYFSLNNNRQRQRS